MGDKGSSSGSDNSGNSSCPSSGASEEERLRRLFNSCDGDGDGFLDGDDLTFMCRMLNMGDSVEEVRSQLGLTEASRISFDDFLHCRTRVMLESSLPSQAVPSDTNLVVLSAGEDTGIESDHSGRNVAGSHLTSWPTLSSDSLGALSCPRADSTDYDSGARDLSPEPVTLTLTQLMETHEPQALKQLKQAGVTSLLEIANRLHSAALTSMKGEVVELKNQVHRLTAGDHSLLQQTKLCPPDFEDRLEQVTSRYEERIIELHSVIAELRKKLERHQINVIREEEEFEESDQSSYDGGKPGEGTPSYDGREGQDETVEIGQEFSQVVSDLRTTLGQEYCAPPKGLTRRSVAQQQQQGSDPPERVITETADPDTPPELPPRATRPCSLPHSHSMTATPESRSEVSTLRADNEELRHQTSRLEVELGQMSGQMDQLLRDKEALLTQLKRVQPKASPSHSPVPSQPQTESYPVAKMAELKKLKTCASDVQILGSQVAALGVESTPTAEHLVQSLQDSSSMAELLATGHHTGFEVELERRQAKIDHLKAQNDVLLATLEESKSFAERLSVLMGKCESNHTAHQLTTMFSDHCLEAQDVLTALLDTEMGVLLANCRAAGLGGLGSGEDDQGEVTAVLQRAHHARRRAEGVARHLLSRLDRRSHTSCTPWEDVSTTDSRTASTSSTGSLTDVEFTKGDEVRLREHIQHLKAERAAVGNTVVDLESIPVDIVQWEPRRGAEAQRLDLENAVLVQELMAVKEEKAELKAHSYLLEKEKRALELRLSGKETQEQAFRVQIDHLKGELAQGQPPDPMTLAQHQARPHLDLARDLTLTQEREGTLKVRVNELMTTLEKISRNSEHRHKQSAEFVNDLKRANSALISAFDKAKKKYQGRLKKLESQLSGMRDKYDQVQRLQTSALAEGRGGRSWPNETSL